MSYVIVPFLTILWRVIPGNDSIWHYQVILTKETDLIWAFLLWSAGHSLTVCGTVICSMTIHPITAEIVILIYSKGKLRVDCQQWKMLGVGNMLQTWFSLLLLISAACMIWLHFWVDKNTESKTGSNPICLLPVINIFSIANDKRQSHALVCQGYSSSADSQSNTSP